MQVKSWQISLLSNCELYMLRTACTHGQTGLALFSSLFKSLKLLYCSPKLQFSHLPRLSLTNGVYIWLKMGFIIMGLIWILLDETHCESRNLLLFVSWIFQWINCNSRQENLRLKFSDNYFIQAISYLEGKQCRSRWNGSLWATTYLILCYLQINSPLLHLVLQIFSADTWHRCSLAVHCESLMWAEDS